MKIERCGHPSHGDGGEVGCLNPDHYAFEANVEGPVPPGDMAVEALRRTRQMEDDWDSDEILIMARRTLGQALQVLGWDGDAEPMLRMLAALNETTHALYMWTSDAVGSPEEHGQNPVYTHATVNELASLVALRMMAELVLVEQ